MNETMRWQKEKLYETLVEILPHRILKVLGEPVQGHTYAWWDNLLDAIVSCYPTLPVQKRVSGEQLRNLCMAWKITTTDKKQTVHNDPIRLRGFHEDFILDLLVLLGGEEEKPSQRYCSCGPRYCPSCNREIKST